MGRQLLLVGAARVTPRAWHTRPSPPIFRVRARPCSPCSAPPAPSSAPCAALLMARAEADLSQSSTLALEVMPQGKPSSRSASTRVAACTRTRTTSVVELGESPRCAAEGLWCPRASIPPAPLTRPAVHLLTSLMALRRERVETFQAHRRLVPQVPSFAHRFRGRAESLTRCSTRPRRQVARRAVIRHHCRTTTTLSRRFEVVDGVLDGYDAPDRRQSNRVRVSLAHLNP